MASFYDEYTEDLYSRNYKRPQLVKPENIAPGTISDVLISDAVLVGDTTTGQGVTFTSDVVGWSKVFENAMTSSTGFVAQTGTWTFTATGAHQTSATAESYLFYDTAVDMAATTMEVELAWPAGAGQDYAGMIVLGRGSPVGPTDYRIYIQRDNGAGASIYGGNGFGSGTSFSASTGLGVLTTDTYYTFKIMHIGTLVSVYINDALQGVFRMEVLTQATRMGLWTGPSPADFRNFKIYNLAPPI